MSRIAYPSGLSSSDGPSYAASDKPFIPSGGGGGGGVSCAVTFVDTYAPAVGASAASIDGQRVFVSSVGSTGTYAATTNFAAGGTSITSGKRIVEWNSNSLTGSILLNMYFLNTAGTRAAACGFNPGTGNWTFRAETPIGTSTGTTTIAGTVGQVPAIGVDKDTGNAIAFLDGSPVGGTFATAASGFFSSDTTFDLMVIHNALATGTSASTTATTAAGDYTQTYSGSLNDFCGNAL